MALDQKKLQKKKAKKAQKAKARKKKGGGGGLFAGIAEQSALLKALNAPIYECWEPDGLFSYDGTGIGSVVVSRKSAGGDIAMAAFLVDAFCLGIKDAFIKLVDESQYRETVEGMRLRDEMSSVHPTCARKLVESAIQWAEGIGFRPHKDYKAAKRIFGDIDPAACPRSFEFGRDGKPFYVAGPNDSPAFIRKVHKTLARTVGEGDYEFLQQIDP